ncbi:hypothetical protein AKJ43_03055 [candidate division MSBL1 archaeon SCGC-AAA261D19]|uniref:ABC transporter permease n=4 Tax=candidate division MSBL1 TaxID=215777 RepID=A0A133V5W8_9EURY|nr:hypothetical protein AKJ43_03055 [candidate division MSBL1 archaeon SCGC-AAA261D19]KXB04366.1 hypothetical protein AKJ48_02855 [candidate division MSBL1 archaeon SCGC-AAA261O19]
MTSFENLKIVTRYELLKQVRRKRFYGALVITVLAVVLMIGLYHGLDLPEKIGISEGVMSQYETEIFAMFVTSMGSLAVLAAVFFAGDSIASEFEHKTGYILFNNPVKRSTIVIGKYLACLIATSVILIIGFIISGISIMGFYGEIPFGILGSLGMGAMLACSVIGISFAFSSYLNGGMGATIATILFFMVISPIISSSLAYAGYSPWFMLDRAADAMVSTYGVPLDVMAGGFGGGPMGGMTEASSDTSLSFLALTAYAIISFVISLILTERREVT